jgi:alcohol dehydrogenase
VDLVFDILPPLPNAAPARAAALTVLANGRIVLMGGIRADIALPYDWLMRNGVTMRGQWMYPREAPARLIALVRAGLFDLSAFATTVFSLGQIHAALAHAAENAGPFRQAIVRP